MTASVVARSREVGWLGWARSNGDVAIAVTHWPPDDQLVAHSSWTPVAVRRAWRRRNIARGLLSTVFNEYYRRGIREVTLDVDASNLTGAQELYYSMGMRVHYQYSYLEKEI